jgi:hypothetical protein
MILAFGLPLHGGGSLRAAEILFLQELSILLARTREDLRGRPHWSFCTASQQKNGQKNNRKCYKLHLTYSRLYWTMFV